MDQQLSTLKWLLSPAWNHKLAVGPGFWGVLGAPRGLRTRPWPPAILAKAILDEDLLSETVGPRDIVNFHHAIFELVSAPGLPGLVQMKREKDIDETAPFYQISHWLVGPRPLVRGRDGSAADLPPLRHFSLVNAGSSQVCPRSRIFRVLWFNCL